MEPQTKPILKENPDKGVGHPASGWKPPCHSREAVNLLAMDEALKQYRKLPTIANYKRLERTMRRVHQQSCTL